MYTYTVPSSIKAWIDLLNWKGRTYRPVPGGREGLLKDRRAYVIASRAVTMAEDDPNNFHERFLRLALGYYGLTDLQVIAVEAQARPEGPAELQRALEKAEAAGRCLAQWWLQTS